jgi:hypothetical protein
MLLEMGNLTQSGALQSSYLKWGNCALPWGAFITTIIPDEMGNLYLMLPQKNTLNHGHEPGSADSGS